jgi:hypothetical protein
MSQESQIGIQVQQAVETALAGFLVDVSTRMASIAATCAALEARVAELEARAAGARNSGGL